jgi:hypothetical protein
MAKDTLPSESEKMVRMEGEAGGGEDFDDLMQDLEDNIFGIKDDLEGGIGEKGGGGGFEGEGEDEKHPRKKTLPTLVDTATANDVLKDFMKKEKNQRKYDVMGFELLFKPYWFFTYTAELIMRDENGNIIDSEEIGGRVAIDAESGALADYLQDLLDHEPIELVDLSDELGHVGDEAKVLKPKISETRLEHFVKQKISGALRADKENVSVAGFELLWSPVYKFWVTIKKKTHNVQIDGCGGYPVNYDDVPLKPKTWFDRIQDDIDLLKNPKKWREFISKKGKSVRTTASKKGYKPGMGVVEIVFVVILLAMFLYGLSSRDYQYMILAIILAAVLFWYMNHKRSTPIVPLPAPPYADQMYGPPPPQ